MLLAVSVLGTSAIFSEQAQARDVLVPEPESGGREMVLCEAGRLLRCWHRCCRERLVSSSADKGRFTRRARIGTAQYRSRVAKRRGEFLQTPKILKFSPT